MGLGTVFRLCPVICFHIHGVKSLGYINYFRVSYVLVHYYLLLQANLWVILITLRLVMY
jgi:hypothetical protein